MQPDPFIQAPGNTQSYNRYSYVMNNPLKYTDPSGYIFKKLFKNKVFKFAVAAVAAYYGFTGVWEAATATGGWATSTGTILGQSVSYVSTGGAIAAGAAAGATAGAISGGILTGSLQGVAKGAFSGAIGGAFGAYAGTLSYSSGFSAGAGRVLSQAAGGCGSAKALGGNCARGAKFAGLAESLRIGMEAYSGYSVKARTAKSGAVVKRQGQAVSSESASNMGMSVSVPAGHRLEGRALNSLSQVELKQLYSFSWNIGAIQKGSGGAYSLSWMSEGGAAFQSATASLPGSNSASVFHDYLVEDFGIGASWLNQATIAPAFYMQYGAMNIHGYNYYSNLMDDL